jgi:Ca2+-binding EF-hand superfamily protein
MNREQVWIRRPLTSDDIADLRAEFATCDADGDGRINIGEFESLLQSLGSELSTIQRKGEFSRIDADGNGLIGLTEFRRWWQGD